jgi:hypothetical protein
MGNFERFWRMVGDVGQSPSLNTKTNQQGRRNRPPLICFDELKRAAAPVSP